MPSPDPTHREINQAARAIDANLNRLSEALRVIEDTVRFAFSATASNPTLAKSLKQLRHQLRDWASEHGFDNVALSRDVVNDAGQQQETASEYDRQGIRDLLAANFARAQQSARSLEEFAKLSSHAASQGMERIRYAIYQLEKQSLVGWNSHERLKDAFLYVLIDGQQDQATFQSTLEQLIEGGADVIQLRDKSLDDRDLITRTHQMAQLCRAHNVISVTNDRPDIAAICQTDALHLGQEDMSASDARQIVGPEMLIGISTHEIDQARRAVAEGANYLGAGPTFPSTTKSFAAFPGTDYLRQVADEIDLPVFAIGGIDINNVIQVRESGISRIAVSNTLVSATDVVTATRQLKTSLTSTLSSNQT